MNIAAGIAGLVGAALIIIGSLVVAFNNRPYSPLLNMVSQLGHRNSRLHTLMNVCLILGGAAFGILGFGLAVAFPDVWLHYTLGTLAIVAGVAGMFVGFVPSGVPNDTSMAHLLIAIVFFLLSAVLVGIFSGFVLFSNQTTFPQGIGAVGIVPVIDALIMLIAGLVKLITGSTVWSKPDIRDGSTPSIMLMPTTEWLYIISLNVWVIVVSIALLAK
ncbi:MAG: DUF998 domain-containing protein [Anaerolineae bacterium]